MQEEGQIANVSQELFRKIPESHTLTFYNNAHNFHLKDEKAAQRRVTERLPKKGVGLELFFARGSRDSLRGFLFGLDDAGKDQGDVGGIDDAEGADAGPSPTKR